MPCKSLIYPYIVLYIMANKLDKKISDYIKEDKYPNTYRGPVKEEKYGDWKSVAELEDFKIVFTSPSTLLVPANVDVMFLYKLPTGAKEEKRKKLVIFGKEEPVYDQALLIIKRKKNAVKAAQMAGKFKAAWERARIQGYSSLHKDKLNPFDLTPPTSLLSRAIDRTGVDKKTFAEKIGKKSASLYHHTKGIREMSRETAIEYAEKLNCDPVDLMFNKITIPVWAKANTLKSVELDDWYEPCKLYSYYTDKPERVIVPRDLYRSDLKAIKIDAKGSMYDGQVGFYYYSKTVSVDQNNSNRLVVVGIKEKGFMDEEELNYYFGLYEEIRGKANLINPDPYIENMEDKYIKKNFDPLFIAPIIAMVNPAQIVDATYKQTQIPADQIRKEENIRRAVEEMKSHLEREKMAEQQRRKVEEELRVMTAKLTKQIRDMEEAQRKTKIDLFHKERQVLSKLNPFKTGTND